MQFLPSYRFLVLLTTILAGYFLIAGFWHPAHAATEGVGVSNEIGELKEVADPGSRQQEFIFQYLLGDIAWRRGNLDIAATAMRHAADLSLDKDIILRAYGLALEAGRAELALQMAERMLKLEPESLQIRTLVLRAYIAGNRPDDVYQALVDLLERSDSEADAVVRYIGEAFGRQQAPGQWMGVMERLAQYLPDRPEVHFALSFVARRAGLLERADAGLDRALELRPGWEEVALVRLAWWNEAGKRLAIADFAEKFLDNYPDRHQFRLVFARLLAQWEDNFAALDQLSTLLEHEPDNTDALFSAGLLYLQENRYQAAKEMLGRYLELDPEREQVRLYLAHIARHQQRFEEALTWLSGVHGERYYLEAQLQRGRVLAEQGHLDAALTHLAEIVPRSLAEQSQIYLVQEQLLLDAGQEEKALELLNAALTDIPDDPDLLYARGLVTAQLKRIDEHERDMRRLIELEPDNAHAYNALGYTLADQAMRLEEALVLIEKAIGLQPGDPFILDSLGWVHYRLGNYQRAVDYLKEAMELRSDPEIAAHLGEVLWQQGNLDEARRVWQVGRDAAGSEKNAVLRETILRLDP